MRVIHNVELSEALATCLAMTPASPTESERVRVGAEGLRNQPERGDDEERERERVHEEAVGERSGEHAASDLRVALDRLEGGVSVADRCRAFSMSLPSARARPAHEVRRWRSVCLGGGSFLSCSWDSGPRADISLGAGR